MSILTESTTSRRIERSEGPRLTPQTLPVRLHIIRRVEPWRTLLDTGSVKEGLRARRLTTVSVDELILGTLLAEDGDNQQENGE